MKSVSLLFVLLCARLLVLSDRAMPSTPWAIIAYAWQDIAFVLVFAVVEFATRRQAWLAWGLYGLIVVYVAVNVPIMCLLSTPLTWPLLRATRATLADSIGYHVTVANCLRIVVVLAVAGVLPWVLHKNRITIRPKWRASTVAVGCIIVCLGPLATAQVETMGLHRNVVGVLITSALPRIAAEHFPGEWRLSPFGSPAEESLTDLQGLAQDRNVVLIHLESTGARYLKSYGAHQNPMPNLTKLTRNAILFENAYSTYPETIKSFFSVHQSQFPALDTAAEAYSSHTKPALAQMLAGTGYQTGLFHSGRFMYLGMQNVISNRGFHTLLDAGDISGIKESSFGIDEASTVKRILSWVDRLPKGKRFFITYLPIAGHHPYDAADGPFSQEREIDRYRNALHDADRALGQLIGGLKRRRQYQNTLFVICGDHGEAFGQHEGNYGHTLFIYDENVRVPLIIAAPGILPRIIRVKRVASLVDVMPTILDLMALSIPQDIQGKSLLVGRANLALFCTDYSLGLVGLRDGRWKLIHELDSGRSRLFDLEVDPDEKTDLASQHIHRVGAYREHLLRWSASQKYRILQGER